MCSLFQEVELMGQAVGQSFGIFFFHDLAQALVKEKAQRTDGDAEKQI